MCLVGVEAVVVVWVLRGVAAAAVGSGNGMRTRLGAVVEVGFAGTVAAAARTGPAGSVARTYLARSEPPVAEEGEQVALGTAVVARG